MVSGGWPRSGSARPGSPSAPQAPDSSRPAAAGRRRGALTARMVLADGLAPLRLGWLHLERFLQIARPSAAAPSGRPCSPPRCFQEHLAPGAPLARGRAPGAAEGRRPGGGGPQAARRGGGGSRDGNAPEELSGPHRRGGPRGAPRPLSGSGVLGACLGGPLWANVSWAPRQTGGGPGASQGRMGAGEGPARVPEDEYSGDTASVPRSGLWSAPSRVEAQGGGPKHLKSDNRTSRGRAGGQGGREGGRPPAVRPPLGARRPRGGG